MRQELTLPDPTRTGSRAGSPWPTVLRGAAGLAAAIGVGPFAYAPIMPLMHAQAGMPDSLGASLATANYPGYLAGALLGITAPHCSARQSPSVAGCWSWALPWP
ncbi:YbfB/YjiJ family MFS transporter [Streptomyces sp. NPDC005507]|uniref:YbfB/YjiJ family MFS transporter n=1 Tax=unclassified Streptomyces TaxID=2593676 RepID=UPI0033B63884